MAGKHVGTDQYPNPDIAIINIKPALPGSRVNRAWTEGNDGSRPNAHVTGSPEDLAYLSGAASSRNHESAPPVVETPTLTIPDTSLIGPITEEPAGTPDVAWVTSNSAFTTVTGGQLLIVLGGQSAYVNIQGAVLLDGTSVRVSWAVTSVGIFNVQIGDGTLAPVLNGAVGFVDCIVGPNGNELRFIAIGNTTVDANITAEIL